MEIILGPRYELALSDCSHEGAELMRTIGTILFSHHWFFPFDSVAAETISQTISNSSGQDVNSVFRENWGTPPPSQIPFQPGRELGDLFEQTCSDVLQLLRFARHYRGSTNPLREDVVRKAVATMLMLICGELIVINGNGDVNRFDGSQPDHWNSFITVAAPWLGNYDVHLPAWAPASCKEFFRRDSRACQAAPGGLSAGDVRTGKAAYKPPVAYVTSFKEPQKGCWKAEVVKRNGKPNWLTDYTRYRMRAIRNPREEYRCI
jgi:hypothetical protein